MQIIFEDSDSAQHYRNTKDKTFKELFYGDLPGDTEAEPVRDEEAPAVPDHLKADTTDQTFQAPVRMHGVEGDRDVSQPFRAQKKWHLEIGSDGRPAIVSGEQAKGMKLSWHDEFGCVLVPNDQPTVRPSWKRIDQKHYPGHN